MTGPALQIVMPVDPPFTSYDASKTGNARFTGYFPDVLATIAAAGGFTYTLSMPSSYTDGVIQTINYATTNVDAYFGAYFMTAERAESNDILIPFWEGGLGLMVSSGSSGQSWDDKIWLWTKPFEDRVWPVLITLFIFAAGVFWLSERGNGEFREQRKRDCFLVDDNGNGTVGCNARHLPQNMCTSLQMAISSYFGHSPRPSSSLAKGFGMFYHVFVFVVVTAYIANLAAVIVSMNTATAASSPTVVSSMADAVSQGLRLCVPANPNPTKAMVQQKYSAANLVDWDDDNDGVAGAFSMFRAGSCQGIIYDYDILVYESTKSENCDLQLSDNFLKIPYAVGVARNPAKSALANQLSYQIAVQRAAGTFKGSLYSKWIDTGSPCSTSSSYYKVDIEHFFVPMIVTLIVGLVVSVIGFMSRNTVSNMHDECAEEPMTKTQNPQHKSGDIPSMQSNVENL